MDSLLITSMQNPRVKQAIKLRDKRDRDTTDLFLIEGFRELMRAVNAGRAIQTVFVCPEMFLGENEDELIQRIARNKVQILRCDEKVFRKLSYRDRPDGLLAIAPQKHLSLDDLQELLQDQQSPFLILAEAIEKPGNLGTILRSSDAVGLDGVIVCDRCTDIHNPNVVRASVGTLFTVPVVEATGEETLAWLKAQGIQIVAATPHAFLDYTKADLTGPVAIAVGTEQIGLSDRWMEQADVKVKIPMKGVADSLNVATATTLLLYEALRQREGNVS